MNTSKENLALIKRGTVEILPEKELLLKLEKSKKTKRPLVVKAGFDPTAPDLHLGHLVLLRKMKQWQDLGHDLYFLIGDFTAMIGDPSGRSKTRKTLSKEDVEKNASSYKEQVFRILDPKKTKIVFNSKWTQDLSFAKVLDLTSHYSVARLLERDDFSKRYKNGQSISLIEFMYPIIQGYDSVVLKADIELGGNDQKFNLLVGRELQTSHGLEPQVIITLPLLVGLDGQRKMSKSYGNTIAFADTPYEIFAKTMSISDELMWEYFLLLTNILEEKIESMKQDPMKAKKLLGKQLVNDLYPSKKELGEEMCLLWEKEKQSHGKNEFVLPPSVLECHFSLEEAKKHSNLLVNFIVLSGIEKSKSAVRRLIQSGAIKLTKENQNSGIQSINNIEYTLEGPEKYILKLGKKKYLKINLGN